MKEALKLALEALERISDRFDLESVAQDATTAITAIKEALAQPEQGPVAWMHVMDNTEGIKANGTGLVSITQKQKHPFGKAGVDFSKSYPVISTPLYTSPQPRPWVGLTDEQWQVVADTLNCTITRSQKDIIETALGIEENT